MIQWTRAGLLLLAAIPPIGASAQCVPTIVGSANTPNVPFSIAVSGNYAHITDSSSGLQIIDVSNPTNPQVVGSVPTSVFADDVAVAGTFVYMVDQESGLQVIDVSDPSKPDVVGSMDTGSFANSVAVSDTLVYVTNTGAGGPKLEVIDVSDPSRPQIIGSLDTEPPVNDVAVVGDRAYLANHHMGLTVVDTSDPTNPQAIGSVDTPQIAYAVAVSGDTAYIADGNSGLQIIDVSDPMNPLILGSIEIDRLYETRDVAVSGTLVCVTSTFGGLDIIDAANGSQPVVIGSLDQLNIAPLAVAVSNGLVYLAADEILSTSDGLQIVAPLNCTTGACFVDGMCIDEMTSSTCLALGGTFLGVGSSCSDPGLSNDHCAFAAMISEGDTPFSTIDTDTDGPPLPESCDEGSGLPFESDIWFRYLPMESGVITVSTCNQADFDSRLAAYAGDCDSLVLLACNDDGPGCAIKTSIMQVSVTAGEEVLIRVGGFAADGTGTLTLTHEACSSDLDDSGDIGFSDLLILLSDWGECGL